MNTSLQPAIFIGHGSPMNALEDNRWTRAWQALGAQLSRPRAIAVISAHWVVNATAVTAMTRPRTIHDFRGFPQALEQFQYPAPGAPDVAEEIAATLAPTPVVLDQDQWGLDHGTWSVLAHLAPHADVPVVQIAINASLSLTDHLVLGAQLAGLRRQGILLLGSGNVVHNLSAMDWERPEGGAGWAKRFESATIACMLNTPRALPHLAQHRDYVHAAPTPEHFIPLLYVAGAIQPADTVDCVLRGCAYGCLSMASFVVHEAAGFAAD